MNADARQRVHSRITLSMPLKPPASALSSEENLDHNMLLSRDDPLLPLLREAGERVFVMDDNPTAENIARLIYVKTREAGLPVLEVILWETENCCAAFGDARNQEPSTRP